MTFNPSDRLPHRSAKVNRRVLTGLIAIIAVGGLVWWGLFTGAAELPQTVVSAQPGGDAGEPASGVSAYANAIQSKRNASTSHSTASTDGTVVGMNSACVLVTEPNEFTERVAHELFLVLKQKNLFKNLQYVPPESALPTGERLPNVFIWVSLDELNESKLPLSGSLEAKLTIRMSDQLLRSSYTELHQLTPPQLNFRWTSNIEYEASGVVIETASSRYQSVGRDVANGIAKDIEKFFAESTEKFPRVEGFSEELYPPFEAPPELAFLSELGAKQIISGPTLMRSNLSVWHLESINQTNPSLEDISSALTELGWRLDKYEHPVEHFTDRVVAKHPDGGALTVFSGMDGKRVEDQKTLDWYCVYQKLMTTGQVKQAFRQISSREASELELLQLWRYWNEHADQVEQFFSTHPPQQMESLSFLARQAVKRDDLDVAKNMVLRALAMSLILRPHDGDNQKLEDLAEEIGMTELPKLPVLEALQPGDVLDPRGAGKALVHQIGVGEHVVILTKANETDQEFVVLTLKGDASSPKSLQLRKQEIHLMEGGAGSSDGTHSLEGADTHPERLHSTIQYPLGTYQLVKSKSGSEYELEVRIEPQPAAKPNSTVQPPVIAPKTLAI